MKHGPDLSQRAPATCQVCQQLQNVERAAWLKPKPPTCFRCGGPLEAITWGQRKKMERRAVRAKSPPISDPRPARRRKKKRKAKQRPQPAKPVLIPPAITYNEYLNSDHWKRTRNRKLQQTRHRCERCNKGGGLQVHHKHYRSLGRERNSDLVAVCGGCHQWFHAEQWKNEDHLRAISRQVYS